MVGRMESAADNAGRARHDDLAELLDRCVEYAAREGETVLSTEIAAHARAFRRHDTSAIDRLDALFAWNGPLYVAALIGGWDEEYVGLAAAYWVETADLRG